MNWTDVLSASFAVILASASFLAAQERPAEPIVQRTAKAAAPSPNKPEAAVTISKQTTYITEPLRKDGYVNYVAALNRHLRAGVTPENNAAVPFLKAMGPGEIGSKYRDEYYKLLGIQPLPEKGDYFVEPRKYAEALKAAGRPVTAEEEKWQESNGNQLIPATKRAWSKQEFPILAGWLAVNEKPLALLVAASKRPRRYDPLIPEDDCVMAALLPEDSYIRGPARGRLLWLICAYDQLSDISRLAWQYRQAAWALKARVMLRVDEGRVDEAWEDLLACHRLARLVGQGSTLFEASIAVSLDGRACAGDQGLLQHARLTPAQIARVRADLDKLPPLPKMVDKINVGERSIFLDSAGLVARRGYFSTLCPLGGGGESETMLDALMDAVTSPIIDWDQVLRVGNSWYDRLADAYGKPTRAERQTALDKIYRDRRKLTESPKDWKYRILVALSDKRYDTSRRLGQVLLYVLLPKKRFANDEDCGAMQFDLNRLAFALAAYHADRGTYPARLADLAPGYVAKVPKDIFNDSELHYRQEAGGCLLYSVGINGKDDGGKGYDDREASDLKGESYEYWDDLAVRLR
jgi:hypothetical protein